MIAFVRALVLAGASSLGLSIACSGDDGSDALGSRPAGTGGSAGAGGSNGSSGSSGSNGSAGAGGSGGSSAGSGGTSSDASSAGGTSAGGSSGGGSAGTSPGGDGAGGDGGSGGACAGSHPLVDGGTRSCAAGQCRCEDTDTCYPTQQAARCCNGRMRCFASDGGIACEGTHPLVDGSARSCEEQRCYCPGNDTCYPAASARACCGEAAQCR
jgi:hypothetical protein